MHWQTAGNLKRKEKTKSFLFPWAPLAVTGTGQADDIGFLISGWIKSSKHHWLRAEANPTVGSSPEGVPMPGPLGFGVIFWENSSGMNRKGVWDGTMAHTNSECGHDPSSRAECSTFLTRLQNPTPLPLNYCQWWHMRLLSEIIIPGPLLSLLHLLLHQLLLCFLCWLPQDSLSLLVADQHFTAQTRLLWPDPHRVYFPQKSLVFYGLAPKRKQHSSQQQEGVKLLQIPGSQTMLISPRSDTDCCSWSPALTSVPLQAFSSCRDHFHNPVFSWSECLTEMT